MKNLYRKIEFLSNIAIIVIALLVGAVLVNRYFLSDSPKPSELKSESVKPGIKLSLPEIDWSKSEKTMLLAISANCRFCSESAPFYQKLAQKKAGRDDVRLIVVMPQNVGEAQSYLQKYGISVDEIRQADLDSIYVQGTPTLIVLDKGGTVVESWTGKLPPEKETEVFTHFFGERSGG